MRKNSIMLVPGVIITAAVVLSLTPLAHAGSKGSGKVKVQDISVTKYHDVSSPIMQKSSTTKKARTPLTVRKAGKGQE